MGKITILFLCALISFSTWFLKFEDNEKVKDTEILLQNKDIPISISFANSKIKNGWTPVVLSVGKLNCLLWMDRSGKVSELPEINAPFSEPVCFIDISNQRLRKEKNTLSFDVYEKNNMRTRWQLSPNGTGAMTKKIIFREKKGIELCLGPLRLHLKRVAWDLKEFSPGLFQVALHGAIQTAHQPFIYEKAAATIYSSYEWQNPLIPRKNHSRVENIAKPASCYISIAEREALIALYNSTGGDYWFDNSGWKTPPLAGDGFALPGTENTWYGITCDAANTMVQTISLELNNLNGTLPPELENLVNLQYFDVNTNLLHGYIPPELGNLANLQWLGLDWNLLNGNIPRELGNLANLYSLDLGMNFLSGNIPPELGNMANLEWLSLSVNVLSGNIPPELGNLAKLQYLWIFANEISGCIPPQLGNLANLQGLFLGMNRLSGNIPPELGNLANLQILWLFLSQLNGSIPRELGNLANLQILWLSANQFGGKIPPELGNLANLQILCLASNKLSGNIPANLTNLTNLRDDCSDFKWNALYTDDDTLRIFLNSKQAGGNWENTQTIAPTDITVTSATTTSIALHWTPIIYTADTGGYRVFYSTTPGGAYSYFGMTTDKTIPSLTVSGLHPGTTYYYVVQTRTNPHTNNLNTVDSLYNTEISASTLYPLALTSPNGGESWGLRTTRHITWTSAELSGNIGLELWKADKKLGTIAANIPILNGNYDWNVANYTLGAAPSGDDYKVKIVAANGLYHDNSNAKFSIVNTSLTLILPRGGENWKIGSQKDITWKSLALTGNVKLLLLKGGVQVGVIDQGIPIANRKYTWTVGKHMKGLAAAGSNYTVKICCEDNRFYNSGSKFFKIW